MKNLTALKALLTSVVFIFLALFMNQAHAQVQTPRFNTSMSSNSHGFYEYLPAGYSSGTQTYPLLIALHGVGEEGDGSTGSLPRLLVHGPVKVIDQGLFPSSFTVNGNKFSFIVLSPQFTTWPSATDVEQIINYATQNYRVDLSRIYVTGLSMGGGVTWDFAGSSSANANRIAAIVPISGASYPDMTRSRTIAAANLPVWALHNEGDPTVTVTNTTGYVNNINLAPAPNPAAKMTIFNQSGHDAWTQVYNMSTVENGMNIYQWMLQYKRGGTSTPSASNIPPVSNPGAGQTITLPTNSVTLNGGGSSDPDGTISSYSWTQVVGPNQAVFSNASAASTVANNLIAGTYTFRLTVTDNKGAATSNTVNINVNASSSTATASGTIHVEAESYAAMNAVMTQSTSDLGGGLNVGGINTGSWMDYNVNVPTAGNYSLNVRVATPNSGGQLQLKASNGTVIGTISVPSTNAWQGWTTVSATVSLTAGSQKLRIFDQNGAWNFNWFELAPTTQSVTPTPVPTPTPTPVTVTGATIKIEAESYTAMNSVMTQNTNDAGGGLNVGGINTGSWMDYNVTVSAAGNYTFDARVATPNTGGQIQVKKSDGTVLTTVSIPATSGWQSWATFSGSIALQAGTQKIRISSLNGAWNFNWFQLTPSTTQVTNPTPTPTPTPTPVPATGLTKYVKVQVYGGTNPYSNAQWNNWNIGAGAVSNVNSGSLKYSDGTTSSINTVLSASQAVGDNNTAYGSGMAPAEVLRYTSYSGSDRTLTISGLSTTGKYNVELYASRYSTGNNTIFTVNGVAQTIATYDNLTNKAAFTGLAPNAQGQIVITIGKTNTYSYLNGFTVTEQGTDYATLSTTAPASIQTSPAAVTTTATSSSFSVFPNPFTTNFTLQVNNSNTGAMNVQMIDASGVVKKEFNLMKDVAGQTQVYLSASDLAAGTYTIKVQIGTWSDKTTIVKQ